jgi:hypothetical protein
VYEYIIVTDLSIFSRSNYSYQITCVEFMVFCSRRCAVLTVLVLRSPVVVSRYRLIGVFLDCMLDGVCW